jgi:tetratricopeptide (TPR) repeat protein
VALELEPKEASYWRERGWTYYDLGKYAAAIADQDAVIELDPGDCHAYWGRALAHRERKETEEAIDDLDRAIDFCPELGGLYIDRGWLYYERGDISQTHSDFDQAVAVSPDYWGTWFNRGVLYDGEDDYEAAAQDFGRALELEADAYTYYLRGDCYRQLGQLADARADFETCLELSGSSPDTDPWRVDAEQWLNENPPNAAATPKPAAQATPLPGTETIPISQMAPSIPWLPSGSGISVQTIQFNTTLVPVNDRRVRQALSQAVNRRTLVDTLAARDLVQEARPATTFLHRNVLGRDLYRVVGLSYDPDRARQLLADAGYPGGSGFPKIVLAAYPGPTSQEVANLVADMWRTELGIEVEVQLAEGGQTYWEYLQTQAPQAFRVGWTQDLAPPDRDPSVMGLYHSEDLVGYDLWDEWPYFVSADLDDLLEEGLALVGDPVARQAVYIQAERILCEQEAFIVPLYHAGEATD